MVSLIRRATLILAMAVYLASMFVPLGSWADGPGEEAGWMPGVIGLFAVFIVWDHEFGPLLFLSWFANPAFWFGFYLLIAEKPARSALRGRRASCSDCSSWRAAFGDRQDFRPTGPGSAASPC